MPSAASAAPPGSQPTSPSPQSQPPPPPVPPASASSDAPVSSLPASSAPHAPSASSTPPAPHPAAAPSASRPARSADLPGWIKTLPPHSISKLSQLFAAEYAPIANWSEIYVFASTPMLRANSMSSLKSLVEADSAPKDFFALRIVGGTVIVDNKYSRRL